MTTKTETQGSNTQNTAFQFNPQALNAYTANIQQLMPFLRNMVTNPFGSDAFQQESTVGQDQANAMGSRLKSNIFANANALGYGTNGGLQNQLFQNAGFQTAQMGSQAFRQAQANALSRQMTSAGMLNSFQPLMTGSNSSGTFNQTQQQGGLGTWLPQLIGAGIGAATAFGTGGASLAGGAGGGGAGGFTGLSNSAFQVSPSGWGSMPNPFAGGPPGYGYGSAAPSGNFINPFMFGGK